MNENEVVGLINTSKSEKEWNANCDIVKSKCNGYPDFWYRAIVLSGLAQRVASSWGGDADLHVTIA